MNLKAFFDPYHWQRLEMKFRNEPDFSRDQAAKNLGCKDWVDLETRARKEAEKCTLGGVSKAQAHKAKLEQLQLEAEIELQTQMHRQEQKRRLSDLCIELEAKLQELQQRLEAFPARRLEAERVIIDGEALEYRLDTIANITRYDGALNFLSHADVLERCLKLGLKRLEQRLAQARAEFEAIV